MKPYSTVSMHKRFEQNEKPKINIPAPVTEPKEFKSVNMSSSIFSKAWDWVLNLFFRPRKVFVPVGNPFFFNPSKQESISNRTKLNLIRHGRWHGATGKSKRIQMQGRVA